MEDMVDMDAEDMEALAGMCLDIFLIYMILSNLSCVTIEDMVVTDSAVKVYIQ